MKSCGHWYQQGPIFTWSAHIDAGWLRQIRMVPRFLSGHDRITSLLPIEAIRLTSARGTALGARRGYGLAGGLGLSPLAPAGRGGIDDCGRGQRQEELCPV